MFYRKWKIKNVVVLDVRSAAHLEAFLIKQGVLFSACLQCFSHVQRHARAIARLICRSLCGISKVPGCHLFHQMSYQRGSQKLVISEGHRNYFKDWCLILVSEPAFIFNLFLTQWLMAILSKGTKAGHFEPCNSPKLSCTIIWGLCFNFVECECFLESIYPDILALCETNLDDSIDSGNFSVRCFLPLRQRQPNFLLYGPDWP